MIKTVVKYKYQIILMTFFIGVPLGAFLSRYATDFLDKKRIDNYYYISKTAADIITLTLQFIPPFFLPWIIIKFLIFPFEARANNKQNEQFNIFINSLKSLHGTKVVRYYKSHKVFFEFIYDIYKVDVAQFEGKRFISLFWYNRLTNENINARVIDFDKRTNNK